MMGLRWFKYSVQNESLSTFEHQACLPIWKISAKVYESLRVDSAGRLPSKSLAACQFFSSVHPRSPNSLRVCPLIIS